MTKKKRTTMNRTSMEDGPWNPPKGKAVYVQVPYCPDRCDYCSIPVTVSHNLLPGYLEALEKEVGRVSALFHDTPPVSLYLGGGSPTSLPLESFDSLMAILSPLMESAEEVTLESRPEALTDEVVERLGRIPRLRLSLGMEAIDGQTLQGLGRSAPLFAPKDLLLKIRTCLDATLSMDFIVTGPDFETDRFLDLCGELRDLGLDHLSVYPLVIESHTVLSLRRSQGKTKETLEEVAEENWRRCCEALSAQGWIRYEVSNFSRSQNGGCKHNLHIWRGGESVGLGPGAHQTLQSVRYNNVRSIHDYVRSLLSENRPPFDYREELTRRDVDLEMFYTNLRLSSGVPLRWISSRTNSTFVRTFIDEIVRNGYGQVIQRDEKRLVLSGEGLFLLDSIAMPFLERFSGE